MDMNSIVQRKMGELMMALAQAEAVVQNKDKEIADLSEKLRLAEHRVASVDTEKSED